MAITLGTFTQLDDGVLTGTFKTLNVTASLAFVPIEKTSDKAPDHRVSAGPSHEVGAGWSQVAKSSGETYINLKIGSPEFGPNWVRCRLVKLEKPAEDGAIALWEHATSEHQRPATGSPRRGFFAQPALHADRPPRSSLEVVSPDFRSSHTGPRRSRFARGKIGTPAPRFAGACGLLDPAQSGMAPASRLCDGGRTR